MSSLPSEAQGAAATGLRRSSGAPTRPLPPTPGGAPLPAVPGAPISITSAGLGAPSTPPIGAAATAASRSALAAAAADAPCNPFNVDIVIPFDIADAKTNGTEVGTAYDRLVSALESAGLRVTSRPGRADKGAEEVWVFVGITDGKVAELVARERITDQAHGMRVDESATITPATRLRLLYELLTSPGVQHGLGITPGEGTWSRVKGVVALHDEDQDEAWVHRWTVGGDWRVGLLTSLGEQDGDMLGRNQTPEIRLYFNFLSAYTRSLLPIAVVAGGFWFLTPPDSYPPLLAFCLSVYACSFIATWRIRQRKLAVRWGTRGCESVSVQLRPQYVAANNVRELGHSHKRADLFRDGKVLAAIPIILGCGALLACVLSTIFLLEAFVGHLWIGPGKAVVPYVPMAMFSLVVPRVVLLFNALSGWLVKWEDHPTFTGATKSLTAKTFAMNATVAYLGLYLTAYVYLPFGPYFMAFIHNLLSRHHGNGETAPATAHHERINVARLKGQMFAYMVTNQVINTFLEVGLPYVLRFVNDWREGKVSLKDLKGGSNENDAAAAVDPETRFLDKVAHELTLPAYNIFTDYAEMVTQFGYVVVWGLVWPLAPLFALINNYFELRSDAIKICKHVQRPIGGRVESIGTWLDTMGIIAWVGAWTSTTLVYLFRPNCTILGSMNATLAGKLASYDVAPSFQTLLPRILPVVLAALAASHGYFVLNGAITALAERIFWLGSEEQLLVAGGSVNAPDVDAQVQAAVSRVHARYAAEDAAEEKQNTAFWNGTQAGADEIRRVGKTE